jgi:hypothetical protein
MASKHINRGIRYEKRKSNEHGGRHRGGPGAPDYQRGSVNGEVKGRQSKVTKPELQTLINKKGITEIVSKAGFTQPAIDYRNKWQPDVRLIHRKRNI